MHKASNLIIGYQRTLQFCWLEITEEGPSLPLFFHSSVCVCSLMTRKRKVEKKILHINTEYSNSSYHTNHLFVIMSELVNYIHEFGTALKEENPSDFIKCITISPTITIANTRKEFPEPNDVDLFHIPEKFRPVLKCHIQLMKAVYNEKSLDKAFDVLNQLILNLIMASDFLTNWINRPLIKSLSELVAIYKTKESRNPEDLDSFIEDDADAFGGTTQSQKSCLESLVITFRKACQLSLGDKNLDSELTKRNDVYYFLANFVKYCFKLGKLDLAKSVIKAVKNISNRLPALDSTVKTKKYGVIYLYYQALMALDDGDYIESEENLEYAMKLMDDYQDLKSSQLGQILLVLIPLKLHNHGQFPLKKIWLKYPVLRSLYRDNFLKAILEGNIAKFNQSSEKFQIILLKKHLYVLIEMLRPLVHLQLIKKTYRLIMELNSDSKSKHLVPISAFQLALEYSTFNKDYECDFNFAGDHLYAISKSETECILGYLISKGRIRAYLSTLKEGYVVFAKTDTFPKPQ